MSNTEPTLTLPAVTVVNGNTTDFEVCGNPDLISRVVIQSELLQVQTWVYGYVDPTTNTYIHSHEMEVKKGTFL